MKEEYVTYDQAVALKRLGFIEETTHYYVNFKSDSEIKLWSCNPPYNHNARLSINEVCSAPRLDQAQSWLREVKGTIVYPEPGFYRGKRPLMGYGYHIYDKDNGSYCHVESDTIYDSYELALSAGISAAIVLLEKEVK